VPGDGQLRCDEVLAELVERAPDLVFLVGKQLALRHPDIALHSYAVFLPITQCLGRARIAEFAPLERLLVESGVAAVFLA
jgi:hypothetical protein